MSEKLTLDQVSLVNVEQKLKRLSEKAHGLTMSEIFDVAALNMLRDKLLEEGVRVPEWHTGA